MVLKAIFPGCGVWASLMLFFSSVPPAGVILLVVYTLCLKEQQNIAGSIVDVVLTLCESVTNRNSILSKLTFYSCGFILTSLSTVVASTIWGCTLFSKSDLMKQPKLLVLLHILLIMFCRVPYRGCIL